MSQRDHGAATGYIFSERRQVVWTMTQSEARDVARWMRSELGEGDVAQRDADALDAAADDLDPLWKQHEAEEHST